MTKITQAELKAVLEAHNRTGQLADAIQKRLHDGAEVEPGEFTCENEYGEPVDFGTITHLCFFGINIAPAPLRGIAVPEVQHV